jgi:hypothetical protein
MRPRLIALSLAVVLSLFHFACTSKPTPPASDDSTSSTAPANTTSSNMSEPSESSKPRRREEKPAPAPAPQPIVIPAGTALTVRLGSAVGSKISQPGQSFSASLSVPVQINGATVIPAGATASGTVIDAKPLGRFAGGASLSLKLNSINVNGQPMTIATSSVIQTEKGKGKRTAVMAGGGAALGALIGGLAGGGKGAGIGALAGGGAGTGGAAFTGNKEIVLPAESALTFTLSQPLTVNP